MRCRSLLLCALAAVLAAVPAAAKTAPSWAQAEIKAVTAAGLMGTDPATFRPNDPLTRGVLEQLIAGLTHTTPRSASRRHRCGLGLTDAAKTFAAGARAAGLTVPSRFGNEATARLLGLRTNHPAAQD